MNRASGFETVNGQGLVELNLNLEFTSGFSYILIIDRKPLWL